MAHVDIEVAEGVKIYGVRVSQAADGSYRAFGPENERGRTCAFSHETANKIALLTVAGLSPNERLAS
ncbi:hypothetical protein A1D31_10980 [Bradyrhizobium liaoningense]|nr:hypothetical protein A1D31_10980 [Bradyrhizobium liaoningense]